MASSVRRVEQGRKFTPKKTLILASRIGNVIIFHSAFFSLLAYLLGVSTLLALPLFSRPTYFSENALLPGSSSLQYSGAHASLVVRDLSQLRQLTTNLTQIQQNAVLLSWAKDQMHQIGCDMSAPPPRSSCEGGADTDWDEGWRSWVVRAGRGDGHEGLVLVTPLSKDADLNAYSIAFGLSVMRYFNSVQWLSKDVLWLVTTHPQGVSQWLRRYHALDSSPRALQHTSSLQHEDLSSSSSSSSSVGACDLGPSKDGNTTTGSSGHFHRVGFIVACVAVEMEAMEWDAVEAAVEGDQAMLPNLDLLNTLHFQAVTRERVRMVLDRESPQSASSSPGSHIFGSYLNHPHLHKLQALFNFLSRQAAGVPTGSHGPFKSHSVEALTLRTVRLTPPPSETDQRGTEGVPLPAAGRTNDFVRTEKLGRIVEGTFRSCNNLLERFHQSFFLYLLLAPDQFISIEHYMPSLGLLILGLPLTAAGLLNHSNKQSSPSLMSELWRTVKLKLRRNTKANDPQTTSKAPPTMIHDWMSALYAVTTVHLWSIGLSWTLLIPSATWWKEFVLQNIPITDSLEEIERRILYHLIASALIGSISAWLLWIHLKKTFLSQNNSDISAQQTVAGDPKDNLQEVASPAAVSSSGSENVKETVTAEVHEIKADAHVTILILTVCIQALGLAALGCLNFALAVLFAVLIVPLCFVASPTFNKNAGLAQRSLRFFFMNAKSTIFIALFACAIMQYNVAERCAGLIGRYQVWNAIAFPYIFWIFLPGVVICYFVLRFNSTTPKC